MDMNKKIIDRYNRTSVTLTKVAQVIKDKLSPIYGLKNTLSAGLFLFGSLSSDEQKKVIQQISDDYIPQKEQETKSTPLADAIKQIVEKTKAKQNVPAMSIIIQPSDEKVWDELKKIADLELEKDKKKVDKTA